MLDSTGSQRSFQPMPDASAPGAEVTDQPKIRVLIVDDHSVVRMGLRMFFDHQPDIEVVVPQAAITAGGNAPAASDPVSIRDG